MSKYMSKLAAYICKIGERTHVETVKNLAKIWRFLPEKR